MMIKCIDTETGSNVNFHLEAFKKLLTAIIIKYTDTSEVDAHKLVKNHYLFKSPITSFEDIIFFSHETEYHWAMLIAYGNEYWRSGISSELPPDYEEWEQSFLKENNLPTSIFEWD